MMYEHGIDNVRGGGWSKIRLDAKELEKIQGRISAATDRCFICHQPGHFASGCPDRNERRHQYQPALVLVDAGNNEEDDDTGSEPEAGDLVNGSEVAHDADDDELDMTLERLRGTLEDAGKPVEKIVLMRAGRGRTESLDQIELDPSVKDFMQRYEPRTRHNGVYMHQAKVLRSLARNLPVTILTSGTGSGKSLCFFSWVINHLARDDESTALILFPTQALLWDQADRLARVSGDTVTKYPVQAGNSTEELAYAGTMHVGSVDGERRGISWTVWHGKGTAETLNAQMAEHEASEACQRARILVTTPDKVHWSLSGSDFGKRVAKNLACVVIDEVHLNGGLLGANLHYLLQRLKIARRSHDDPSSAGSSGSAANPKPHFFFASATIGEPREFAGKLAGENVENVMHVQDEIPTEVKELDRRSGSAQAIDEVASHNDANGHLRVLFLTKGKLSRRNLGELLSRKVLGGKLRALCFSPSKAVSREMKAQLSQEFDGRLVVVYDADLPPAKRRMLEQRLNSSGQTRDGATVLGTSALEVGVDISGMDVAAMPNLPVDRMALMQRIGRVGRDARRPGIVVIGVDPSTPSGEKALRAPEDFLNAEKRTLVLPLNAELVKLTHARACAAEFGKIGGCEWSRWVELMRSRISDLPTEVLDHEHPRAIAALNELAKRLLPPGATEGEESSVWFLKGFRGGDKAQKVPIVKCRRREDGTLRESRSNGARNDLAWLASPQLFTVAHPQAVMRGDDGNLYGVKKYVMRVPGRKQQWAELRDNLHGPYHTGAPHEEQGNNFCVRCIREGYGRRQVIDCRFRQLHVHPEEDLVCLQCPILSDGSRRVVEQCPVSSRRLTPCAQGQWLYAIKRVWVERLSDSERIGSTRGEYLDSINFKREIAVAGVTNRNGVTYGIFDVERRWEGYFTAQRHRRHRDEVFREELDSEIEGRACTWHFSVDKPFRTAASFETTGFQWEVEAQHLDGISLDDKDSCDLAAFVVQFRMTGTLECALDDCRVDIGKRKRSASDASEVFLLRVVDVSPCGNGLAYEALVRGGVFSAQALANEQQDDDPLQPGFSTRDDLESRVLNQETYSEDHILKKAIADENLLGRARVLLRKLRDAWRAL